MEENKYKDIEDILYKGFIPMKMGIKGINFVFKSVTDVEYEKISLMSGMPEPKHLYTYNFHLNFFFHSIYLVNGSNFLKNRDERYSEFIEIVKNLPNKFIYKIFEKLESLAIRQNECTKIAEPYFYERVSRYNWISKKGYLVNDPISTSIYGTEDLGLNQFQKYWAVFNLREDQKEEFEEKYGLTKFLASFTDSKSVRKVEALDKRKKEEEESRRNRIIEYGNDPEEYTKRHLSGPTDTAEQLVESLNKQIRGEKDKHDIAVEEYEKKMKEDMLRQMQSLKKMRDERTKDSNFFVEEARPISQEEMMKRIKETENKPKFYFSDENSEDGNKYMDMSNVSDQDIIKQGNVMSEEEYNDLVEDDLFKGKHSPIPEDPEEEYLKQQRQLAVLGDFSEEEINFPNLRKK